MRRDIWQWTFLALLVYGLCGGFLIASTYVIASTYGKASFVSIRLSLHNVSKFALVAIMLLGPCFGVLTHELGHVVAGWLVGFRFQLFVVGPFLCDVLLRRIILLGLIVLEVKKVVLAFLR